MRNLLVVVLFAVAGCSAAPDRNACERPNVVFIMADDLGYGDLHAYQPQSLVPTPHLDALCRDGTRFTDAHTPSSVCTPTRYGVLTGRYCWRGRLQKGVLNGYGKPLIEPGRRTVADLLRAAGYRTAVVGKWHLGLDWARTADGRIDFAAPVGRAPNAYGFDHSYIIPASLDFPPYVYVRDGRVTDARIVAQPAQPFPAFLRKGERAQDLVIDECFDHLVDHACAWVRDASAQRQPFFLYLPLPAPHKPVVPTPAFRGRSGLGDYADFVMQVDAGVGRVLQAIDAAGVRDETLVVFTSDNGSYMHRFDDDRRDHVDDASVQGYRARHHRANGPLRGTKADIWEAGHRVPFVVRWPGSVPAGAVSTATICLTDFLATCAELVGRELDEHTGEDSFPFLAAARGERTVARAPVVHHSVAGMFALRKGRWKLVCGNGSGGRERPRGKPFAKPFQLFDLANDLAEQHDVAAQFPDVVAQLSAELERIRKAGRSR